MGLAGRAFPGSAAAAGGVGGSGPSMSIARRLSSIRAAYDPTVSSAAAAPPGAAPARGGRRPGVFTSISRTASASAGGGRGALVAAFRRSFSRHSESPDSSSAALARPGGDHAGGALSGERAFVVVGVRAFNPGRQRRRRVSSFSAC